MECAKPGRVWSPSTDAGSGSVSCEPTLPKPQSQPTPGCTSNGEDGTGKDCDIVGFPSFLSNPLQGEEPHLCSQDGGPQQVMSHLPRPSQFTTGRTHLLGAGPGWLHSEVTFLPHGSWARRLEQTQRPMPSLPSPQDQSRAS